MIRCSIRLHTKRAQLALAVLGAFTAMTLGETIIASTGAYAGVCTNPNALGVSRVIEIDTSKGPKFGLQQYKKHNILRDKEVVLTFDDGPTKIYTVPILKALEEQCTKATFFMVGQMARAYPSIVRKVAALGHTVGTHSWSHQNLARRSGKRGIREIELAVSVIGKILGRPPAPFFRFPYLADPKRMIKHLQERDIAVFSIDVDSKDYLTRNGSRVTNKIMRDLKRAGKGIILFHDIQKSSARALPQLLRRLKAQGYKVVHLKAKDKGVTDANFDVVAARMYRKKTARVVAGSSTKTSITRKTGKRASAGGRPKTALRKTRKKYSKAVKLPKAKSWTRQIFQDG